MKAKKPTPTSPSTASTRALSAEGRSRPKPETAPPQSARISTQSTMEPSWLPQVALSL